MSDTIEYPTIENPTADQLEAGGTITGTFYGLPFTDWPLTADRGWLTAGGVVGPGVRDSNGRYCGGWAITFYTPPEPKPWEDWADDDLIEVDNSKLGDGRSIRRAAWLRREHTPAWIMASHPRRVLIADADTEVIVPKAALDRLREAVDTYSHAAETDEALAAAARIAVNIAATTFLAAVDERSES